MARTRGFFTDRPDTSTADDPEPSRSGRSPNCATATLAVNTRDRMLMACMSPSVLLLTNRTRELAIIHGLSEARPVVASTTAGRGQFAKRRSGHAESQPIASVRCIEPVGGGFFVRAAACLVRTFRQLSVNARLSVSVGGRFELLCSAACRNVSCDLRYPCPSISLTPLVSLWGFLRS